MKIKFLFFIIISSQLILISCSLINSENIEYYQSPISKYSTEVKVFPNHSLRVGFILNISEFKKDEKIFFKISLNNNEVKNNLNNFSYHINYEQKFNIEEDSNFPYYTIIKKKIFTSVSNSRKIIYFEESKKDGLNNYLKFILESNASLIDEIGFTNTEKDESKDAAKVALIALSVSMGLFFLIIVCIAVTYCTLKKKKKSKKKKTNGNVS